MNKQEIIRFFDERAAGWDAMLELAPEKIAQIFDAAGVSENDAVLDIACGTGVLFHFYLARGVSRIDGVDIAPEMVARCREKYGNNSRIKVRCADAEEAAFDAVYDRCMVYNAFPHFCRPEVLLRNLYGAVKTGGTVTVAHDRGIRALDSHHAQEASAVSRGMMPPQTLEALLSDCGFCMITSHVTEEIYIVSATK